MIDEKQKAQARARARKLRAAHADKACRKKETGKRQRGRLKKELDAKPTVWKPEGCVYPDCECCPLEDCMREGV